MNNFTQPYLNRGYAYPYMQTPMQQNLQQPIQQMGVQNIPQYVEPTPNYDFYGVQVRSFEEAKNYPYCCEKPLFLLDAQNEKVYIKKIENGIPSVVSYDMKEIKENTTAKEEKKEEVQVPQFDFSSEFQKMKEELSQQFSQEIKNQVEALKVTRENENKGNKKW